MIYLIILLFLTGLMVYNCLEKNKKLIETIIFSFLIGLIVHTVIFTILTLFKVYYSKEMLIVVSLLSLLLLCKGNWKKLFKIKNNLKGIPIYYLIIVAFVFWRLYSLTSTLAFDYYHWDELSFYQTVSRDMFMNHNFIGLSELFTPMVYFVSCVVYDFCGLSLTNPRIITCILFIIMSLYIYSSLKGAGRNRHISALIASLFLFSSSEILIFVRSVNTNLYFAVYVLTSVYLICDHYFIKEKNSIPVVGYLLLFGSLLTRREGIIFIVPVVILLNIILVKTKKIKLQKSLLLFIPIIGYQLVRMGSTIINPAIIKPEGMDAGSVVSQFFDKFSPDSLFPFLENVYSQTFAFSSYFFNYMTFIVFLAVLVIIIYRIIKKKFTKETKMAIVVMLIEFIYFGIVFATVFVMFSMREFLVANSFSRYITSVLPINFILLILLITTKENKVKLLPKESPKVDNPKVLIIIPAYNEEENINDTYNSIIDYNKKNKTSYDVIVINDGSKDQTKLVCEKFNIPHINLINNLGIGGAVQTGYQYAKLNEYDIAIQFDGDGQHDVNYVKNICSPIIDGQASMVVGSRFIKEDTSEFKSSKLRRIGIRVLSGVIKLKTGSKIYDTTSGFRACNKDVINIFAEDYPIEYPEPISTVKIIKSGYKVAEVPVEMKDRTKGTSSITTWKSAYYMVNVIMSILITEVDK